MSQKPADLHREEQHTVRTFPGANISHSCDIELRGSQSAESYETSTWVRKSCFIPHGTKVDRGRAPASEGTIFIGNESRRLRVSSENTGEQAVRRELLSR